MNLNNLLSGINNGMTGYYAGQDELVKRAYNQQLLEQMKLKTLQQQQEMQNVGYTGQVMGDIGGFSPPPAAPAQAPGPGQSSMPMQQPQIQPYQALPSVPSSQMNPPQLPPRPQKPQASPTGFPQTIAELQQRLMTEGQAMSQKGVPQMAIQKVLQDAWTQYAPMVKASEEEQHRTLAEAEAAKRDDRANEQLSLSRASGERSDRRLDMEGKRLDATLKSMSNGQKAPAGFRWKDDGSELEPIKGGRYDPNAKVYRGIGSANVPLAQRMNPTMLASVKVDIGEIDYGLSQIEKLATDTASPFFEDTEHEGAISRFFKKSITPEQSQQYDTLSNRFAIAIASLQSMGRGQISDAKVAEAKKLVPVLGDAKTTVQTKLNQIRRIKAIANHTLYDPAPNSNNPVWDAVDANGGDTSQFQSTDGQPPGNVIIDYTKGQ